ncbi:MAG TPA: serine hydrolase, partial [Ignisphaera aggregans]|nr:serine hydrolase [Ignisphaera aggregans]
KSFTALAIMKLVEEGKLSLDDAVERYVPLKLRAMGEPIRIHHLLTHTSGIAALAYAEAFIRGSLQLDGEVWLPLASPQDVISYMSSYEEWVVDKPGKRFFYLNEGYVLLGYIISKVTGIEYEDYVKQYILRPLSMNRTYFRAEEVEKDPNVATPYIIDREGRHIAKRFPFGITADGGLLSNAMDMARYVTMLINRGRLEGTEIVSPKSVELMERKYVDVPWKLFGDEGYGYGLIITEKFFDRKLVGHSGSVLVYTAYMGYLPSDGIGVVVLANASGYPLSRIGMYALALALGHNPEKELSFLRIENTLRKLEGVYEAYRGSVKYYIERRGDFLALVYRDRYTESTTILVPEEVRDDYARFYTLIGGAKVYAEFFIERDRVTLLFERYKLVKRGRAS